jgi:glutaminyl-peptide cyclotransferase
LVVRDPERFAVVETIKVRRAGGPVGDLNELEWVPSPGGEGGDIWANVWMTDSIVRIDASSGQVLAEVDAGSLLLPAERAAADVLNGIAFDPERRVFLLTGKLWPRLFEVSFEVDPEASPPPADRRAGGSGGRAS